MTTITPDDIDTAYAAAQETRLQYARAAANAMTAKEALRIAEAEAVRSGVLAEAKNDTARAAILREACALLHALLLGAETDEVRARGEHEAACFEVQRVLAKLELMRLEKS